jgi:hypothetical protein
VPYDERDDDSNQFKQAYPDDDFITAVTTLEPAGTREVADHVGCSTRLARYRLNNLVDDDRLEKHSVSNVYIYTIPADN